MLSFVLFSRQEGQETPARTLVGMFWRSKVGPQSLGYIGRAGIVPLSSSSEVSSINLQASSLLDHPPPPPFIFMLTAVDGKKKFARFHGRFFHHTVRSVVW